MGKTGSASKDSAKEVFSNIKDRLSTLGYGKIYKSGIREANTFAQDKDFMYALGTFQADMQRKGLSTSRADFRVGAKTLSALLQETTSVTTKKESMPETPIQKKEEKVNTPIQQPSTPEKTKITPIQQPSIDNSSEELEVQEVTTTIEAPKQEKPRDTPLPTENQIPKDNKEKEDLTTTTVVAPESDDEELTSDEINNNTTINIQPEIKKEVVTVTPKSRTTPEITFTPVNPIPVEQQKKVEVQIEQLESVSERILTIIEEEEKIISSPLIPLRSPVVQEAMKALDKKEYTTQINEEVDKKINMYFSGEGAVMQQEKAYILTKPKTELFIIIQKAERKFSSPKEISVYISSQYLVPLS